MPKFHFPLILCPHQEQTLWVQEKLRNSIFRLVGDKQEREKPPLIYAVPHLPSTAPLSLRPVGDLRPEGISRNIQLVNGDQEFRFYIPFGKTTHTQSSPGLSNTPTSALAPLTGLPTSALAHLHFSGTRNPYFLKVTLQPQVLL